MSGLSEDRSLCGRIGERLEVLGLRTVLVAYWGTTSVLARRGGNPRTDGGESVRPKR